MYVWLEEENKKTWVASHRSCEDLQVGRPLISFGAYFTPKPGSCIPLLKNVKSETLLNCE